MSTVLKVLVSLLLAAVIFFRGYFPSVLVYWLTYPVIGVLFVCIWLCSYWVSRKQAVKVLKAEPEFDIFCSKVPFEVTDDFCRGRLCVINGKVSLVSKEKGIYKIVWSKDVDEISSVVYGTVGKVKKGFILWENNDYTEFSCRRIGKYKVEFEKCLKKKS